MLADDTIDLLEWSLYRILLHDLDRHHLGTAAPRVRHRTLPPLLPQCKQLLSMLAHVGHEDLEAARTAFEHSRQVLGMPQARLAPHEACSLDALDDALVALDEAAPPVKWQILQAVSACITADRKVTATEAELLRAIAVSLSCPMPPLLPT